MAAVLMGVTEAPSERQVKPQAALVGEKESSAGQLAHPFGHKLVLLVAQTAVQQVLMPHPPTQLQWRAKPGEPPSADPGMRHTAADACGDGDALLVCRAGPAYRQQGGRSTELAAPATSFWFSEQSLRSVPGL